MCVGVYVDLFQTPIISVNPPPNSNRNPPCHAPPGPEGGGELSAHPRTPLGQIITSTHSGKTMGHRATNASGRQWRGRDGEDKGKGEGTSRDARRNGFQGQGRIQRQENQLQKEGQERNSALGRKVGSFGASEGSGGGSPDCFGSRWPGSLFWGEGVVCFIPSVPLPATTTPQPLWATCSHMTRPFL